jgi:hypothetical protein
MIFPKELAKGLPIIIQSIQILEDLLRAEKNQYFEHQEHSDVLTIHTQLAVFTARCAIISAVATLMVRSLYPDLSERVGEAKK